MARRPHLLRVICALGLAACGPDARPAVPDAPPIDAPSASRWAVVTIGHPPLLYVVPFDGAGFRPPCLTTRNTTTVKDLVVHPTMPYVYGIGATIEGAAVGCEGLVATSFKKIGAPRPLQRIVLDPSGAVGFFTIDGPTGFAAYRFTTGSDGVPTVEEPTVGPTISGALALDATTDDLFVGGMGSITDYQLFGPARNLPAGGVTTTSCLDPVDLLTTGSVLLEFCSDTDQVQRYTRNPFAFDTTVGALGAVDHLVRLPGDRAVAARSDPPMLELVDLGGGSPTWNEGPLIDQRVTAMGASRDGDFVVVAWPIDASSSQLAAFDIRGEAIRLVGTQVVDVNVTAIAVMTATP